VNETDPILVDYREYPILRSFMDIPGKKRVTHAVSVGNEAKVNYTYDMAHGSLFQVWRGEFLDATPMWNNRGDGSSKPSGSIIHLGTPVIPIAQLSSENAQWMTDTTGTSFKPHGYKINDTKELTFLYEAYGASVSDDMSVLDNGHGLKRTIQIQNNPGKLYFLLGQGKNIAEMSDGRYVIDDKTYFVELADGASSNAMVRKGIDQQELIIPVTESLVYTLLF